MAKGIIRLCYRKIIDASSAKPWDKHVFDSSYTEYAMQSQLYNREKKYTTFAELLLHVQGADKLHFLVSASIAGYMHQLNGRVPDLLNNLGKHFLEFTNYHFEIINSDIKNKAAHRVAINFFSEPLIWHDTIDNFLLVSPVKQEATEDGALTIMVQVQPFLSIYSLKKEEQ